MFRSPRLALVIALAVFSLPLLARAEPPPAVSVPGVPSLDDAPLAFAQVVVSLATQGKWGAFAALLVFGLVFALRKFAAKLPEGKVREALLSKWGGWALNFALALAGGVATLALGSVPLTAVSVLSVVFGAVTVALSSAGLVELQKDATKKGAEAAAAIDTKAEAVAVLAKGPPHE